MFYCITILIKWCAFYFAEADEKEIVLPKQLEAVTKATTLPLERHRWNTNEVLCVCVRACVCVCVCVYRSIYIYKDIYI